MILSKIKSYALLILGALLLLSAISTYFFYHRSQKFAREAKIWENNYEAERQQHSKTVLMKELEIEKVLEDKRIDSTIKAEGIREKEIQYVYLTKYRDTGSVRIKVEYLNPEDKWAFPITTYHEEKCYKAYWTYDPTTDSSTHSWEIETDIQGTVFTRKEKEFRIFKWTVFRYGHKNTYLTVTDHCNNKEIISNQLIKVKD